MTQEGAAQDWERAAHGGRQALAVRQPEQGGAPVTADLSEEESAAFEKEIIKAGRANRLRLRCLRSPMEEYEKYTGTRDWERTAAVAEE